MPKERSTFGRLYRAKRRDGTENPVWRLRVRWRGKEHDFSLETTSKTEAKRRQRDWWTKFEATGGRAMPISFKEFVRAHFIPWAERRYSESTLPGVKKRVSGMLVPFFGPMKVRDIRTADVERFIAQRRRRPAGRPRKDGQRREADEELKPLSGKTLNRDLSLLSSVMKRAVKLRYAEKNPVETADRYSEEEREVQYVSIEGQDELVKVCHPKIRPLVVLALNTGLRESALLRLEWSDIDWRRRQVRVGKTKNKTVRVVGLPAPALEELRRISKERPGPALHGAARVFSWIPPKWSGHYQRLWKRAVRAASGAGFPADFHFHDLRHLFAVNVLQAGVPLSFLMEVIGHKSARMAWKYARHVPDSTADTVRQRLDAARGAPGGMHGDGEAATGS